MANSLAARSAALLDEDSASSADRFVEMGLRLVVADTDVAPDGRASWRPGSDEVLIEVGGRWDRRRREYTAEPTLWVTLRLHRGQEESGRWLAGWLRRFAAGDWSGAARVWSALLVGGRRSGKSHLACVFLVAFAVMQPKAVVWAVSPRLEAGEELDRTLAELLALEWYKRKGLTTGNATSFRLANGSEIFLRSGHKAHALKMGRVDVVLFNEAQLMDQKAYLQVRGAIADRHGLVLLSANPPDTASGRWVEAHYHAARSGQVDGIAFDLDPQRNPFIEYEALASISKEVDDEKVFMREVLGLFAPIGDVVFHAWSERESWRDPPADLVDITADVTRRELGRAAGYVVGMDFQLTPHMAAVVLKVFRDPNDDSGDEIAFIVDEVVVENADENDLIDALEACDRWTPAGRTDGDTYRGWAETGDDKAAPVHCAVVADASGWWQDGAHSRGKTSDQVLKARRWTWAYKPQKDSDKNPDLVERCKVANARLKVASGRQRLFVARHCVRTAEAMRRWEIKNGLPYRRSDFAHISDAVTYPIYRLWGRPKPTRQRVTYDRVPLTRASDLKGL